ncbi:hypothetical protein [Halopiger xanaduensis]|uniref:Uncharacterized protein n=1 Tax=Halopiger xanaduensis (strain DSM 18323 / JCM 14033 / SH-6) TaxID=797210 RepID=F8DEV7_HALXS|nr:hypothetical protein [Halopiger xanaduensis]AEH39499.1 hypothetical protein Halxa_0259 [Halopiger xanaduensis SH-6]
MSQTQRTQQANRRRASTEPGPLALVSDDTVLRCHDERTGWQWFYDIDGGEPRRYHEAEDYQGVAVPETIVAETLALGNVEWYSVSRTYLEVYAGDSDGE